MAASQQQTTDDQGEETGAERIAAAVLFFGVLVPVLGLAFGWNLALHALEVIGVVGGVAILVWNLGRGLPRLVSDALFIALAGLAMGLVFDWEQASIIVVAGVGGAIWNRWRGRDRPAI